MKLLAAVLLFAATTLSAQTIFTGEAKSVAEADHAWTAAFAARDTAKSLAALAPDAAFFAPNAPLATGASQIEPVLKAFFALPGFKLIRDIRHAQVSGDLAFTDGDYRITVTPGDRSITEEGKYLTIWTRDATGHWLVLRDIFNSSLPPR